MKVTLESTTKLVTLNGVPARVWAGVTEAGIPCHAFVTRIAVSRDDDISQFERELAEQWAPSTDVSWYPARMVR